MKILKSKFWLMASVMLFAVFATSCLGGTNTNPAKFAAEFLNITPTVDGKGTALISETGGTYFVATAPPAVDFSLYKNNRAYVYYKESTDFMPGYDKTIDVLSIQVSDTYYGVQVASSEEGLKEFGSEGLITDERNVHFSGKWIDMLVSYYYYSDVKHKFYLVRPADNLIPREANVTDEYIYLELHHWVSGTLSKGVQEQVLVSFNLPDQYNPHMQGKKGIILKFDNLDGEAKFLTINLPTGL